MGCSLADAHFTTLENLFFFFWKFFATSKRRRTRPMPSIDGTPLLPATATATAGESSSSIRAQGLRRAARAIRRASRGLREPSMAVRETAAQEIEDRQDDWAYCFPVVILDATWNSAFVSTAIAALFITWSHSPCLPLRLWIAGYALQCVVHVVCVSVEYRRRRYGQQSRSLSLSPLSK